MKQGSFELPPLGVAGKSRGRKVWAAGVAIALLGALVMALVVIIANFRSHDDQTATSPSCVPSPTHLESVDSTLQPKSTNPADYPHPDGAPLAPCPTTPADIFPPDSGIGIVFEHAVFKHCALQVDGPDALCHLAYASGPNLLPQQPANPAVNIEGREYGNCRFDGPLTNSRMSGAGRDDQVSDLLRCFLLPMN